MCKLELVCYGGIVPAHMNACVVCALDAGSVHMVGCPWVNHQWTVPYGTYITCPSFGGWCQHLYSTVMHLLCFLGLKLLLAIHKNNRVSSVLAGHKMFAVEN